VFSFVPRCQGWCGSQTNTGIDSAPVMVAWLAISRPRLTSPLNSPITPHRTRPDVGGVVHTHSTYASVWAARAEPIPCVLTAMADEFGGDIPVGPFAIIGDIPVGRGIVSTLQGHRSRAVLMRNHGVFTIGANARDAVKAAVMCEDVARTVHLARQLGDPLPIPAESVDALFTRPDRLRPACSRQARSSRTGLRSRRCHAARVTSRCCAARG